VRSARFGWALGAGVPGEGVVPWLVVDEVGKSRRAIHRFLRDRGPWEIGRHVCGATRWRCTGVGFPAGDRVAGTWPLRSEVRDFVLWLQSATIRTRSGAANEVRSATVVA